MTIGTQTQGSANTEKKTYDPLSPGMYEVTLDRVQEKTASTGSKYKDLTFKVASGEHEGRLIFNTRFFTEGVSQQAIDISNQQADRLFKALGSGGLESEGDDFDAFQNYIGTPVVAKVDVEYNEGYAPRNKIKAFQRR